MLVLALDTTTPPGSCAVARDGIVIAELAGEPLRSHAERLPGELMQLLARTALTLADVDAFAVAIGPGSFTGLRVGIATMQGLAFASGRPLLGISALDALARDAGEILVAAWIDAWRGDVYAALYDHGIATGEATIGRPEQLLDSYPPAAIHFIGDGAATHWEQIQSLRRATASLASPAAPLLAGTIARMATALAAAGQRPGADAIRPLYVRRPVAQPV